MFVMSENSDFSEILKEILSSELFASIIRIILISGLLAFLASITITLVIAFYNKSRNTKAKWYVYVLIFVFGWLGALIYFLVTKDKSEKPERTPKQKKQKAISFILLVLYFALCISAMASESRISNVVFKYLNEAGYIQDVYYDKYGNTYSVDTDVIYYTADGCKFIIDEDSDGWRVYRQYEPPYNPNYQLEYNTAYAYLDKDGYIFFTENEFDYDFERKNGGNPYFFYDENNEFYADPQSSYWNENGELCGYDSIF